VRRLLWAWLAVAVFAPPVAAQTKEPEADPPVRFVFPDRPSLRFGSFLRIDFRLIDAGSGEVLTAIQESGYLVSYNSEYLRRRNWIQICLMGDTAKEKLVSLLNALNRVCFRRRGGAMVEAPAQEVQSKASSAQS